MIDVEKTTYHLCNEDNGIETQTSTCATSSLFHVRALEQQICNRGYDMFLSIAIFVAFFITTSNNISSLQSK